MDMIRAVLPRETGECYCCWPKSAPRKFPGIKHGYYRPWIVVIEQVRQYSYDD